jgi:hypothetical protein
MHPALPLSCAAVRCSIFCFQTPDATTRHGGGGYYYCRSPYDASDSDTDMDALLARPRPSSSAAEQTFSLFFFHSGSEPAAFPGEQ